MRTLVADGNFKQDHLAMKNDNDDVPLNDGLGYMVGRKDFKAYMDAVPPSSKSTKVHSFDHTHPQSHNNYIRKLLTMY